MESLDLTEICRLFEEWVKQWKEAHPEEEMSLLELIEIFGQEGQEGKTNDL